MKFFVALFFALICLPATAGLPDTPEERLDVMRSIADASNLEPAESAISTLNSMLAMQFPGARLGGEKNKEVSRDIALVARLTSSMKIVAAQIALSEIMGTQRYYANAYESSSLKQLTSFTTTATQPPADDELFIKSERIYLREAARYSAWPQPYRFYAEMMVKSGMYDDEVAHAYCRRMLEGKGSLPAIEISRATVKRQIAELEEEPGHSHE